MRGLKGLFRKWNKEVFGNIDQSIARLEDEIAVVDKKLEDSGPDEVALARREALLSAVNRWYKRRTEYWKQQSREKFLSHMDHNSKYFHMVANIKQRKKNISELLVDGRMIHNSRIIKKEIRDFYKSLYVQKELPFKY